MSSGNRIHFKSVHHPQEATRDDHLQELTIKTLTHLVKASDEETGLHLVRSQRYVEVLAHALKDHPKFKEALSGENLKLIVRGAPLHDLGKVGIPEEVLFKPGKLSSEEWEIIKTHSKRGAELLRKSLQDVPNSFPFLEVAAEIAHSHHEHWDGSGYPDGLKGEEIPVSARIVAVVDVFDALITTRPYKRIWSLEEAKDLIEAGRGTHFDPDVVDAFCESFELFSEVAESMETELQPFAHNETQMNRAV